MSPRPECCSSLRENSMLFIRNLKSTFAGPFDEKFVQIPEHFTAIGNEFMAIDTMVFSGGYIGI